MRTLATSVLLWAVLAAYAFAEEPVDKSKHAWAKFNIGSSTKAKTTMKDMGPEGVEIGLTTLKEVTDTECVLLMTTDGEAGEGQEERLPLRREPEAKKVGTETVKAAGRDLACTIWETVRDFGFKKDVRRDWIVDDNGLLAKSESTTTGKYEETDITLLVEVDKKVRIGNKDVTCWVLETTFKNASEEVKTGTIWCSPDVPGFKVREETFVSVWELVDFTVK